MQQRPRVRLEPGGLDGVCSFCSAGGHEGKLDPVGLSSCNGGVNWAVQGQPYSGVEVRALNGRVITWVEPGVTVHAVATGRDQTGDGNQQRVDFLVRDGVEYTDVKNIEAKHRVKKLINMRFPTLHVDVMLAMFCQ